MMLSRSLIAIIGCLMTLNIHANPKIEHWLTANGTRVYFTAAPELPMLDISIVFDAGSARDGEDLGSALMTNAILNEGAIGLNADQIAAKFEDVGARFSSSSQRDMALLSLRSLTDEDELKAALTMFKSVLVRPDFPQGAFERIKKQILIGFQAEKQSSAAIASRVFYSELYGNHPYASMSSGDEESVKQLTLKSLKAFYRQYYVSKNAVIVLVGAVNKQQAMGIAEQLVSELPEGQRAKPLEEVQPILKAVTKKIDHPTTQTHILMGQLGMSRGDADYYPLYVGNHILGGSGLVSRLNNEIREKRGLSYSVYSYYHPMQQLGPFQLGLQTKNSQADEALQVLKDTLRSFVNEGATEEELTAAKQNITGGFALRLDSNSKIAGYLTMIGFYGLPLDYLDVFKAHINDVTIEQIKDAYLRRINIDKMITVMVGGKK